MAKTINNWCLQGIVHSVQMDCSFRRNDGKNDNRSNRNGTTLLALDCYEHAVTRWKISSPGCLPVNTKRFLMEKN